MDTCIYCNAPSIFSTCDDCGWDAGFNAIADAAPVRATRTNTWWAPATFFSAASMLDSDSSVLL